MQVNKELQEYYDLREQWGRLTNAGRKIPKGMLARLEALKEIVK